ncbi:hypothetical protein HDV00_002040, partial [Rhizophlyctis rosea]
MANNQKIEHVLNLDLTSLHHRLKRTNPLTPPHLLTEYKRFLALKLYLQDTDPKLHSPSPQINECWHHHIIDTRAYEQLQRDIGMTIHHDPDGAEDEGARRNRRRITLAAYEILFKDKPPGDVWDMGEEEGVQSEGQSTKRKYE